VDAVKCHHRVSNVCPAVGSGRVEVVSPREEETAINGVHCQSRVLPSEVPRV